MKIAAPLFHPIATRLSDVRPVPVRWLWPGRIALGKLTLLAGDPGLGKSMLTLDLAARLTSGRAWPDSSYDLPDYPPSDVVLLSAEDDLADTIRPRLDAAGADPARVLAVQGVKRDAPRARPMHFDLSRDLLALESMLETSPDARMVIVDPLSAYLGDSDSHNNAEVRGLLAPLSELASRRNVAVVVVTHLNKGGGERRAMYRSMGSLAFIAAARAAWLIASDRSDATRRLMLPLKNNLAPDTGGLSFRVTDGRLEWDPDPIRMSADEALSSPPADAPESGPRYDAAQWLTKTLHDGPMSIRALTDLADAAGFSIITLRRAASDLNISIRKIGLAGGWEWALPGGGGEA